MLRVPVQNPDGTAAMPTKPSRARRWVRDGIAIGKWSDAVCLAVLLYSRTRRYKFPVNNGFIPSLIHAILYAISQICTQSPLSHAPSPELPQKPDSSDGRRRNRRVVGSFAQIGA